MAINQITTLFIGEVGVSPSVIRIDCTDSFATVTSQNFLLASRNQGYTYSQGDVAIVKYGTDVATQTSGFFVISLSSGNITLVPSSISATLPVVSGNFAIFSGTSGTIHDAGFSPSSATQNIVAMVGGPTIVKNLAVFSDTSGTVVDAGARILAGTTPVFGGGIASNAFTVAGLTSTSHGSCVIRTATSNTVTILTAVPSANTLTVLFSTDPGANTTVDYIYSTAALT